MANTSLRADTAGCNVVQLPTAAPRKIANPSRAAREYRRSQPQWHMPMLRIQAEAKALSAHHSPALLIALCILKTLPPDHRRAAQDAVHWLAFHADDETSWLASLLVTRMGGWA